MADQEVVERAKAMGWLPAEEFRGNPDNHKTPEDFIRMAENSLPIAKGTITKMESTIAQQNAMIADLKADMSGLVEHFKGSEQRAYDQAVKDLQKKQSDAEAAGDMPAFVEATKRIQEKINEHPAVTGKATTATTPAAQDAAASWYAAEPGVYEKWTAENEWLKTDPDLFDYADKMDRFLNARDGLTKPRSYRLSEITRMVKEKFPEKFGNPARAKGSPVEGDTGGRARGNGEGHTFNDLPEDAKKQAIKWCGKDGKGESGTIKGMTFKDFAASYKW